MPSAARIGVAGIGLMSPLGEELEGCWDRLIAGHGAVARMAFDDFEARRLVSVAEVLGHRTV